MESEKKRSTNFSFTEESLLISLVKKYKDVIENKKSDTESNFKKIEIWKNIEREFNNLSGASYREAKVLKKKYDNLKKRTKKKFADEKCYKMGTGGGPSKDIYISDVDTEIKEILGCRVEGLVSEYSEDACTTAMETTAFIETQSKENDIENNASGTEACTSFLEHDYFDISMAENIVYSDVQADENADPEGSDLTSDKAVLRDWSKYTPDMLRTPVSKPLAIKNNGTPKKKKHDIDDRISQWAEAKSALESDRQRFLQEEHNLKLQCFKERHEEELRCMRQESELRMQFAREEHGKKMEILDLEKKKVLAFVKK